MIGCLCIGCRAECKAFLAVPALLSGYLWNKAYLPSGSSVKKANGIFLLDFSAVSYTDAALIAEESGFEKVRGKMRLIV
jgi:hypothetical protein